MGRLSATERRRELREYLNNIDFANINRSSLAKKYSVDEKTIRNDLELLMKKSDPEDLHQLLWKFDKNYKTALQGSLQAYRKAVSVKEIVDSVKAIAAVTSEYLNSLAKLGYPVSIDGAPPQKPDVQSFINFLESPRYKQLKASEKKASIPSAYDNINFRPPAAGNPIETLPRAPDSIPEQEEDDLEPITDEDEDDNEEDEEPWKK